MKNTSSPTIIPIILLSILLDNCICSSYSADGCSLVLSGADVGGVLTTAGLTLVAAPLTEYEFCTTGSKVTFVIGIQGGS